MTVRRLAVLTSLALVLLALALVANRRASARELEPVADAAASTEHTGASAAKLDSDAEDAADTDSAEAGAALAESVAAAVPDPPAAIEALALESTPAPIPTPTPLPAAELEAIVDVEPPVLIELPADLIATPTPDTPEQVPLPFLTNISSAPRDGSVVYLTFDDGPDPIYTNQILDVLAAHGAKATFFVIGNSVDAYPGVVQRMVAEGHTVANHTYFHEALPHLDPAEVDQTLVATNGALGRAIGRTTNCLRPPYGAMDQATYERLAAAGWNIHMWEVDSQDWQTNDSYAIASNVLSTTNLGDRVLFHDGPSNRAATVAALDSVLQVLGTRGVQFHALSC